MAEKLMKNVPGVVTSTVIFISLLVGKMISMVVCIAYVLQAGLSKVMKDEFKHEMM